jgi:hypothetical protein
MFSLLFPVYVIVISVDAVGYLRRQTADLRAGGRRFDGVAAEGPKAPGSTLQDALKLKRLPGSAHPNVRSVTHQTATFRHYTGQKL